MMKVVINRCHGGFSLSPQAMMRYAELAGITLYHKKDSLCDHYYKVPVDEYNKMYEEAQKTGDYRQPNDVYFSDRQFDRYDPHLVQVVEELGPLSWGSFSKLKVVDVPDDVDWTIENYGGMETIAEIRRTWC